MYSWEKEKAYRERRAAAIAVELEECIATVDSTRFQQVYENAMRYMNGKTRAGYYRRMLEADRDKRKATGVWPY